MTDDATKGSVLLLDDDKFLLEMYAMKFKHEGYAVQACLSADDAIAALSGGFAADAVIFDVLMPECDGFAFIQKLSEKHLAESAAKIALTNQSDDAEKSRMLALGADRYLIKATMIPSEVVTAVGEEIAKKKGK